MRLGFGAWEPDSAGVDIRDQAGASILADAKGVYPGKNGYIPVPSLQDYSTFALPSTCVGAFVGRTSSGGYLLFAGTTTKLYKYDPSTGWVDYTRTVGGNYNVPSGDYWSFTQFGSRVIACNINDDPQYIDIDTGAVNFALLAGTPPKSRYAAVVGDFLVLACQNANPLRIVNSAINDSTGWTPGVNLCDQQDFADGGRITGLAGGEYGWVLQEHAIRRMLFQPGFDQAFRFERLEREHGAAAGYSLVAVTNTIFFYSDDGFYSFNGTLNPIGSQRINQWFRDNSDSARYFSILAFTDPFAPRVGWAFYNSASSTYLDRILFYDWSMDRWSYAIQSAQYWGRQVTAGTTLEGLNTYGTIDTGVPYSLDSRVWEGGQPVTVGISTLGHLAFLNGSTPMDARILTCPIQLNPSQRSFVRGIYPIGVFNDATVALRVGKREHTKNTVTYSGSLTPSTQSGIARVRSSGRVHEFEVTLTQSSGNEWDFVEGLDVDVVPDGLQ